MKNKEFKGFLKTLFSEHVEPNLAKSEFIFKRVLERNETLPKILGESHEVFQQELKEAMYIIKYIKMYCDYDDDIYYVFSNEKLLKTLVVVKEYLKFVKKLSEDMGFLGIVNQHFLEIYPKLESKNLPEEDFKLLEDFGSKDPEADIDASLFYMKHVIKNYKTDRLQPFDFDTPDFVTFYINDAISRIEEKEKFFEKQISSNTPLPDKPKRKWWKGFGKIITGAGLVGCDIALVVGKTMLDLPDCTASIASTTTGFGHIMFGVGELKNE